jgi:hypothetical protein
MIKSVTLATLVALSVLATSGFAQEGAAAGGNEGGTVALVDRSIVLPKGTGEVGLDLWINLSKGMAGKAIWLSGNTPFDRYPGITFGYGVIDNLQLGFSAPVYAYTKGGQANAGFNIFGTYQFLDFLAGELQIQLPSFRNFGDNRAQFVIGFPFKYAISKGFFALHARPDFIIWLPKKDTVGLGKSLWFSIFFDVGATFNFTKEFFADLSFGIGKVLTPSGSDPTIPLSITLGYTVIPQLDLGLFFGFNDLKGAKADARYMGLQAAYRF